MPEQLLSRIGNDLESVAPTVMWVLLTLIVGFVASRVAGRVARWLARRIGLETLGERIGITKLLYAIGLKEGLAVFAGQVVFYCGLLITFAAVAELLHLPSLAALSSTAMEYLPRLVTAFAIGVGGVWAAGVVEALILKSSKKSGRLAAPKVVGRVVYHLLLVVAFTVAAQQAGLDTGLVSMLVGIATSGVALAMALSFSLGSRDVFASLIARYYVASAVEPGDRVRVGELEGRVVKYTSVTLVIALDDGSQALIPCSKLATETVLLLPTTP